MNLREITLDAQALQITAHHRSEYLGENRYNLYPAEPQGFEAAALFSTREAAEEFAALFPKSAKLRVERLVGFRPDDPIRFMVSSRTTLAANDVNGGVNETGVKRYRSLLRAAEKAGVAIEFASTCAVNAYETREAFEEAIS